MNFETVLLLLSLAKIAFPEPDFVNFSQNSTAIPQKINSSEPETAAFDKQRPKPRQFLTFSVKTMNGNDSNAIQLMGKLS